MNLLYRILCWLGFHKIDETKWSEKDIWKNNVFETNCCIRCKKIIFKRNGKKRSFKNIKKKIIK